MAGYKYRIELTIEQWIKLGTALELGGHQAQNMLDAKLEGNTDKFLEETVAAIEELKTVINEQKVFYYED